MERVGKAKEIAACERKIKVQSEARPNKFEQIRFSSYKFKHVSRLLRYRNVSVQGIPWTRGGCCWKDRPLFEADLMETPQDSAQQTKAHAIHIGD